VVDVADGRSLLEIAAGKHARPARTGGCAGISSSGALVALDLRSVAPDAAAKAGFEARLPLSVSRRRQIIEASGIEDDAAFVHDPIRRSPRPA